MVEFLDIGFNIASNAWDVILGLIEVDFVVATGNMMEI
jgi:hypothetical protein